MNAAPMILRFCSGSVTPASRSRNRSVASTNSSGSFRRSNRVRTCAASFSRSRPLSTKMHVSRSPMRPVQQHRRDRRVHAARQPAHDPARRRPCARIRADALVDERRHRPVAAAAADVEREVAQDLRRRARCARPRDGTAGRRAAASASCMAGDRRVRPTSPSPSNPGGARRDEVAVARPDLAATPACRRTARAVARQVTIGVAELAAAAPALTCPPSVSVISCMP